jgi:alpha-galactosidase
MSLSTGFCDNSQEAVVQVKGKYIQLDFNDKLHSRVIAKFKGGNITVGDFSTSEFITVSGKDITDFSLTSQKTEKARDKTLKGQQYIITGRSGSLSKEITATVYDKFPYTAFLRVKYTNIGDHDLKVNKWVNNRYTIKAKTPGEDKVTFWSYQSGSYRNRPDWVLPLKAGFKQDNYMGMNGTDYGGGTPISDVWQKEFGIGVGHLEMVPKLVSLPVSMPEPDKAVIAVEYKINKVIKSGESLTTFRTFATVHTGDHFRTLSEYRRFMTIQGFRFERPLKTAYEPVWCGWGYERNFTIKQIVNTLGMVKKLGYQWAVIDDGWQTAEGDWYLIKSKFPNGDEDMKKLVDKIHAEGLKAKLWWAPLSVDPGTDLIKNHPDLLLLNKDGSTQDISWWDAYYLCPAYPDVTMYTKRLVTKIMETWGFDGLKIDGQYLNAAPPCYNRAHNHSYPEESFEKMPEFFKAIYETALAIKPDAVVEICPCGTAYSFFTMPYMNQPVSSDPTSSWQIRLKGKTFKALMGPTTAYYGDHVELSDNKDDFASTVGVGGIIGTKLTWPVGAKKDSKNDLTAEKEKVWEKWIKIYNEKMLPRGVYMGSLYDIGFDKPETHTIRKDSNMYYAFYADSWDGQVELRGLDERIYNITDYVNQKYLGKVKGPAAKLKVKFDKYLLVEAKTEQ